MNEVKDDIIKKKVPKHVKSTQIMHLDNEDVSQMIHTEFLIQTPMLLTLQDSGYPNAKPTPTVGSPSKAVGYRGVECNIKKCVGVTSFKTALAFSFILTNDIKK